MTDPPALLCDPSVFVLRPGAQVSPESATGGAGGAGQLLWTAPGSLATSLLASRVHRSAAAGISDVPGPWGVAVLEHGTAEVVVAVDPIGVQPVYWARTASGRLLFSPLLSALVDRDDVDDAYDYEGVLIYNALDISGPETRSRTPFRAVHRIPGGHRLRVRADGSVALEEYWDAEMAFIPGLESLDVWECAELLREVIDTAIHRSLADDSHIAAHASGGLDSSAIAVRAHRLLLGAGRPGLVAGYSWAPDAEAVPRFEGDERQLVDEVAAVGGFPIRMVGPEADADWWWGLDPIRYPEETHWREVLTLGQARRDGVRVMLSGWGGDEFASHNGYRVLEGLLRRGRVREAWRESSERLRVRTGGSPLHRRVRRLLGAGLTTLPIDARRLRHPMLARQEAAREATIHDAISTSYPSTALVRRRQLDAFARVRSPHQAGVAALRSGYLAHRTAAWYQTGSLMGIQYRYPLLDLDVVRTALSLPWWAFLSHGWDRTAFRLAVEPWVPPSVAWNLGKDEPALLSPALDEDPPTTPRARTPPRTDEALEHALHLARLTWQVPDGAPAGHARLVSSRPDLAPRAPSRP